MGESEQGANPEQPKKEIDGTPTLPNDAVSARNRRQQARDLEAQGIPREEIAETLGVAKRTLSRYLEPPTSPDEVKLPPLRERVLTAYAAGTPIEEILSGLDKLQRHRARNILTEAGIDIGSRKKKPEDLTQAVIDNAGSHKSLESLLLALQEQYPDLTKEKLSQIAGWLRARKIQVPYAQEVQPKKPSQT